MRQEIEVMRVLRVPPMGKLVIEMGGNRYERVDEVIDEASKRRLLTAVGELVTFAGNYEGLVNAGVAPPLTASATTNSQTADEAERLSAEQARFLRQLEEERDALKSQSGDTVIEATSLPPELPPHIEAKAQPAKADLSRSSTVPRKSLSIAEQIDTVLQELKSKDPELAHRAVRLRPNPAGGLHIEVDGALYDEPGDIEDTAVQALIRQAVQTWHNS